MSDQQTQSDTDTPVTVDDVWVNRLAGRIGVLTAQNERLLVENEALQQQAKQLQEQIAVLQGPPVEMQLSEPPPNGERQEVEVPS